MLPEVREEEAPSVAEDDQRQRDVDQVVMAEGHREDQECLDDESRGQVEGDEPVQEGARTTAAPQGTSPARRKNAPHSQRVMIDLPRR